MRRIARSRWLALAGLLFAQGLGFSQGGQQNGTLIVSGHPGHVPVTRIDGRSYVAVDALARLVNGSLGYEGNQITLTLTSVPPAGPPAKPVFSKDFLNATIETISDIREWRSALLNAVENSYPITDTSMTNYREQAAKNLRLTSVAVTTDSDRSAFQLLSKEFAHMQELDKKILEARKKLNYMTADSVRRDALDQKIMSCAHSLAAMATSGVFQDNGSCN
jgi:anti-sigma28 factor (negative regulator of flagellin synthesis)